MSWLRIDDGMVDHPKVAGLSDSAFRLHVSALCYASRFLTDGDVVPVFLERFRKESERNPDGMAEVLAELADAGLWTNDGGLWKVHDYLEYNPTREHVLKVRERDAERKRKGRESRWNPDGVRPESVGRPIVPYPYPTPINKGTDSRSSNVLAAIVKERGNGEDQGEPADAESRAKALELARQQLAENHPTRTDET